MKQGILITAYKDFGHLMDIASCFDANFEIYIHIDKKSDISQDIMGRLQSFEQVKLVSRKYVVNWGGINHLKSILHLAKIALKSKELKVFHLISGHDYPIKKPAYFIVYFKSNPSNYLSYFKLPSEKWPNGMERLEYFNFYDWLDAKKYRHIILKLVNFQKRYGIKRSLSKKVLPLYGGETWWSLRRDTLQYVIDYTLHKPYLLKRLKHSFCSEEIYFQTVIMNSQHATTVVNDSLRYIDWNTRNGNFPANLDLSDLEPIQSSTALFARKFEFPVSQKLKLSLKHTNETGVDSSNRD